MPVPPSDLKQVGTIAKFESEFENWKSMAGNISLIGLASVIVTIMLILAPSRPPTAEIFSGTFLFPVFLFIPLAAIFFAGNNVTSEFESKTGYIIFSNPVKRSVLVTGKFLASLLYVFWAIIIFYIGCIVSTFYLYGVVPQSILSSFGFALLYGCAVLGFVFLFGSMFGNGMIAGTLSFLILFLVMPLLQSFLVEMGHEPWYLLTYAAGSINAFGGTSMPGTTTIFGMKPYLGLPNPILSAIVILIYFVVLFGLSIFAFKRKDML
ncbi:MAG: hypothetical protein DRN83_01170 [Hadesarchaea archaeon]|nr:MAG: hypothetical protein DRN83_01170 [Hadesarchaea archaeon]